MSESVLPVAGADFRALPIDAAAAVLRRWARVEVASGFGIETDDCFDARELLVFRPLLESAPLPKRIWRRGIRERRPPWNNEKLRELLGRSPLCRLIVARTQPLGWREQLCQRIFDPRRRRPVHHIPESLWDVIGEQAWLEPSFQLDIATWIRAFLRSRVLFRVGDMPVVRLHPNTYWLLLAATLAEVPRREVITRLALRHRRRCVRLLKKHALALAMRPGWATFWDQWAVAELLTRRMDTPVHGRIARWARSSHMVWLKKRASRLARRFGLATCWARITARVRMGWWRQAHDPIAASLASLPLIRAFPRLRRSLSSGTDALGAPSRQRSLAAPTWKTTIPTWMRLDMLHDASSAASEEGRQNV